MSVTISVDDVILGCGLVAPSLRYAMMVPVAPRGYLASLGVVLLCCYFGCRETGLGPCQSAVIAEDPGVAAVAGFMGTKTPYSFLRYLRSSEAGNVTRDAAACQALKVSGREQHCL